MSGGGGDRKKTIYELFVHFLKWSSHKEIVSDKSKKFQV